MKNDKCSSTRVQLWAIDCVVGSLLWAGIAFSAYAQTPATNGGPTEATRNTAVTTPYRHNVYLAGGSVHLSAEVDGDFVAAGGSVAVDQPVKGDLTLAGGSISVRAPVGDDVRVAGGDVNIENTINGELFAVAGNITLAKAARVVHAATLYAGNITLDGKIDGPLKVGTQKIIINGEINGDVVLYTEKVELGPTAKIGGALFYPASAELKKADGATISGAITREMPGATGRPYTAPRERYRGSNGPMWAGSVFAFMALLAFATVLLLVVPDFADQASQAIKRSPGRSIAVGLGALLLIPMFAGLLFITLLGIPLGMAVLMLYPALLMVGYVVGVLHISQRMRIAFHKDTADSLGITVGYFALALLLMMLIVRLPFVGPLALVAVAIIGTGACVLELNRRRKSGAGTAPHVAPGTATITG
jgi:hypothetical protein